MDQRRYHPPTHPSTLPATTPIPAPCLRRAAATGWKAPAPSPAAPCPTLPLAWQRIPGRERPTCSHWSAPGRGRPPTPRAPPQRQKQRRGRRRRQQQRRRRRSCARPALQPSQGRPHRGRARLTFQCRQQRRHRQQRSQLLRPPCPCQGSGAATLLCPRRAGPAKQKQQGKRHQARPQLGPWGALRSRPSRRSRRRGPTLLSWPPSPWQSTCLPSSRPCLRRPRWRRPPGRLSGKGPSPRAQWPRLVRPAKPQLHWVPAGAAWAERLLPRRGLAPPPSLPPQTLQLPLPAPRGAPLGLPQPRPPSLLLLTGQLWPSPRPRQQQRWRQPHQWSSRSCRRCRWRHHRRRQCRRLRRRRRSSSSRRKCSRSWSQRRG